MDVIKKKGLFIVIDGLDGIGKGEIERAIIEYEQRLKRSVFDTISFCKAHKKGLPEFKDFWDPPEIYYDTIITSEPTHTWIGQAIRDEIIAKNSRKYSSDIQIEAYSIDRLISMSRLVIPALTNGMRVIQSRCLASTLNYQILTGIKEGRNKDEIRDKILQHPGNKLQLEFAPDLIIIPTIKDVNLLIKRLKDRGLTKKEDNAIFENLEFQSKLKPLYESEALRKLFESRGTRVVYLDAGASLEYSRKKAVELYKDFLVSKGEKI